MPKNERFVVARAADLRDGERLLVKVRNRTIGIFNVGGRYHGLLNRCPHRGAQLCKGQLGGTLSSSGPGEYEYDPSRRLLLCPWHGWEFDVATGQSYLNPVRLRLRRFTVEVEPGSAVADQISCGDVEATPEQYAKLVGNGPWQADQLIPGPYTAETVEVVVEDDYLVVDLRPSNKRQEKP